MIFWEKASLDDREAIFEYLYAFNPAVSGRTDELIQQKVGNLENEPEMGVVREGIPGRLLSVPDVSMLVAYFIDGEHIRVMRVLHQKQHFPPSSR